MCDLLQRRIDHLQHKLDQCLLSLEENNPANILAKGYAILETEDGNVVNSVEQLKETAVYIVHLKDGNVQFTISNIKKEDN